MGKPGLNLLLTIGNGSKHACWQIIDSSKSGSNYDATQHGTRDYHTHCMEQNSKASVGGGGAMT